MKSFSCNDTEKKNNSNNDDNNNANTNTNDNKNNVKKCRYNEVDIEEALSLWPTRVPPSEQIPSRLLNSDITKQGRTTIFLVRSSNLSILPVLHHYYIEFNDKEWHPGAPDDPIITNKEVDPKQVLKLRKFIECCDYCARRFMEANFERDSRFNLLCNNCQIQFGHIAESLFVNIFLFGLVLGLLFNNIIAIFISITALATILSTSHLGHDLEYNICEHIST